MSILKEKIKNNFRKTFFFKKSIFFEKLKEQNVLEFFFLSRVSELSIYIWNLTFYPIFMYMCGSGSVLGIRVRKSWIRFQYGSGSTTQVFLSRRGNGSTNKQFSDQWHCSIPDKSCCFTHYSKLYRSGWSEKNEAFTIAWIAPGIGKVNPVQVLIHANQGHNRQWLWGGFTWTQRWLEPNPL